MMSIPSRHPHSSRDAQSGPDFHVLGDVWELLERSRSVFSLGRGLIGQDRGFASGIEGQICFESSMKRHCQLCQLRPNNPMTSILGGKTNTGQSSRLFTRTQLILAHRPTSLVVGGHDGPQTDAPR